MEDSTLMSNPEAYLLMLAALKTAERLSNTYRDVLKTVSYLKVLPYPEAKMAWIMGEADESHAIIQRAIVAGELSKGKA